MPPRRVCRRSRWPLLLAWLTAVADLLIVTVLPRSATRSYGLVLLGVSACALAVVLASARRLRRHASVSQRSAAAKPSLAPPDATEPGRPDT